MNLFVQKPMAKPFFSIVIPTFNRVKNLKIALENILSQNFGDFEVIVSDNNSPDNTKNIVISLHDKRIIYRCNKTNIGWVPNMTQAFRHTVGKYILMHGDDDFLLNTDFLTRLQQKLRKNSYGFVRVNYLSYSDEQRIIFDFHNQQFIKKDLLAHSNGEQIVNFIESVDPFFMTGIVIKGNILRTKPLMQSEFVPWFPAMYDAISKENGLLWPDYEFVATWSKNAACPRYYLANGKFQFERYFEEIKKHVSDIYYKRFLDKRLRILISEFPAAKYFTSNANFFRYAIHLLDLNPSFRFSFSFWFWVVFSILMPRRLLNILRKRIVEKRKDETIPNLGEIYKKVALSYKITDISV